MWLFGNVTHENVGNVIAKCSGNVIFSNNGEWCVIITPGSLCMIQLACSLSIGITGLTLFDYDIQWLYAWQSWNQDVFWGIVLCVLFFGPSTTVWCAFRWQWWGVFSFSSLNREYFGNKPMCVVINYFILVFDSGMFFNYMPLSTELVGIPVSSNFSEIHSFPGCSHWEVSQKQKTLLQKELVPEIYPTT